LVNARIPLSVAIVIMSSHMSATIVSSGAPQNTFAVSREQAQVNRFDMHVFRL